MAFRAVGGRLRPALVSAALAALFFWAGATSQGAAAAPVLRLGSEGPEVVLAQHLLYQLGLMADAPDGMFGPATLEAVRQFQRERGLAVDGVVGKATWADLEEAVFSQTTRVHVVQPGETLWEIGIRYGVDHRLIAEVNGVSDPSRLRAGRDLLIPGSAVAGGEVASPGVELLHWNEAQKIYANFKVITVVDVLTGKRFKARRYYGHHHADTEPLTRADTEILRSIYGGWSWDRRPIIVEVDGRRIAASMNGVPHGGGSIDDNGFPGHFCIHFLGSRIHRTGNIDIRHQTAVLRAAGYIVDNIWLARGN